MTNAEIVKRLSQLEVGRKNAETWWQDIGRFILPVGGGDFASSATSESSKNWTTKDVWDSTAPIGAQRLGSFLWSALVGTFRWFDVAFPVARINQDPIARAWMDDTGDRMFDTLAASNFALEFASGILDVVGYGNTCLSQELVDPDKWAGYEFSGVPLKEMYFEEDYRGRVYRFFRKLSWTATQIVSKFGDKVPQRIKDRAAQSADGERYEVIYCVYPRKEKPALKFGEKVRAPLERPFGYKYVLREGAEMVGEEGGYYEMNNYVGRWERAVGTQWGFGPGLLALPTVKLLNALQESIVDSAAKVLDPATVVTERGLIGDLDHGPGGLIMVRSLEDIAPFESKARFDVSDNVLNDHRMMVRKFFREDDIGLKDSPAMTAVEVMQRVTLMNRLFGGPAARIQNDVFDPTIQTTFGGMYREGQIDKPPDIILEAAQKSGTGLKIQYRGPFSRAMRDDEVAAIERIFAACAGALKMGFDEVKDDFDAAQAIREMAERLATPARLFRSKAEAQAIRDNRQKQQQQMAQAEIAKTQGEARRAHAGADEMAAGGMNGQ